jgi:hypothetical protein
MQPYLLPQAARAWKVQRLCKIRRLLLLLLLLLLQY